MFEFAHNLLYDQDTFVGVVLAVIAAGVGSWYLSFLWRNDCM